MIQEFHEYPKWMEVNGAPRLVQNREEEGMLLGITLPGDEPVESVTSLPNGSAQPARRSRR